MEQYFVKQEITTNNLTIDDQEIFRHAIKVLRHKNGDVIYLVDPAKKLFKATITSVETEEKQFQVDLKLLDWKSTELPIDVTVACSLSKKDKIEWITQKSTELGAKTIIFFSSKYSIMNWKKNVVEKRLLDCKK